ncbi:MAG: N-acetylneuraminate synthase family protein [Mucilaginibacter sp.]
MKIDNYIIKNYGTPFIIAEVGLNHNGSLERAIEMIDVAKKSGVTAIKFQTFKAKEFVSNEEQEITYTSNGIKTTESMLKMFSRYELSESDWSEIKKKCVKENIIFLSTPQNISDLKILLKIGVSVIKVGSDDLTNIPLIREYRKTGLPIILSSGMSNLGEVYNGIDAAGYFDGNDVAVLLCTSQYPTKPENINLNKLHTLRNAFPNLTVGFSDHSQGNLASSLAVTYGAAIFEKHFTLDHNLPGPDHWFSEDPTSLKVWSDSIKIAHKMMGKFEFTPAIEELDIKTEARRSICAIKDIKAGDLFDDSNLALRRPGDGIQPVLFDIVLGKNSKNNIVAGTLLTWEDIQ